MKNIVTIGGGTGSYTMLMGIKNIKDIQISSVVAMTDDGGSTGVLRDELGVLPAGDVRQCLIALSEESDIVRKLMTYRFEEGSLAGHNFGNIFLAGLEKVTGSFALGVEEASKVLKIKGKVLPVSNQNASLCVELKNGEILKGENQINHYDFESVGIEKLYIENMGEMVNLNIHAKSAIDSADYIFIGPGNHYCSILPALAINDMSEVLSNTKAKIIYIANLTNKKGHTLNFKISDYVLEIEKYINRKLDFVLVNSESPSLEQIEYYKLQEGDGVMIQNDMLGDERLISKDLLSHKINIKDNNDSVAGLRSFIRHDSDKLKSGIESIIIIN